MPHSPSVTLNSYAECPEQNAELPKAGTGREEALVLGFHLKIDPSPPRTTALSSQRGELEKGLHCNYTQDNC